MENLTKHQIILLTLLTSFVTSIATGIVTVALMNQAPIGVTQTINRVVERTIEKVTTPSTNGSTIKETVVVNVDDQIVSAIDKNAKSIVRIYKVNVDPVYPDIVTNSFVSMGAVVSDDGIIATDNNVISDSAKYQIKTDDGKMHDLTIVRNKTGEHISLLKIKLDDKNPVTGLSKVAISSQGNLKLGQSVVYVGGETKNNVATGIVSSLNMKDIKTEYTVASSTDKSTSTTAIKTQSVIYSVQTSIPASNFIEGGLLFNLSGELVGIKSIYSSSDRTDLFAPATDVQAAVSESLDTTKKTN